MGEAAGWAGGIAVASLAALDAAEAARTDRRTQAERLNAAVQADGEAFFGRMAAACGAGARAFNAAVKADLVEDPRTTNMRWCFSVRAGSQGFVIVSARLETALGAPAPGCMVRHQIHGNGGERPFDFTLTDDGALAMRWDGDELDAERFAERVMTPWLQQIHLAAAG